ncbi:MAG: nuclear transport factor 2 family protein [Dehalococcoidia bacterium]
MSSKETLRVVHEWYSLSSRGDWQRVRELAGPDYMRHEPSGTRSVSSETIADEVRQSFETRGPLRWEYDAFAEGDTAFVTWVARGAHAGDMSGVQAYRVADGRIVETWLSAVAPVTWTLHPSPDNAGDPEASKRLLRRWYEEMYEQRRFAELAPQLCGPIFRRHDANGTFNVTAEEYAERLTRGVVARDEREGRTRMITDYRVFAGGDRVGVIATSARQGSWVQTWRVEDGKFVESWFAGFAGVNW